MAKEGFGGQWVDICRVGTVADSSGTTRDLSAEFLEAVIRNYRDDEHEAPIVIGHPNENAPAFGWVTELRLNGDRLEAHFSDTDDEFERLVEAGKYRKRSASFYLNPPALRHVGFLGAQPPAVKGLKNIQFAEGESITFENSFTNNQETKMEDKDVEKVSESVFAKITNFFKETPAQPLNLSEAAKNQTVNLSEDAVKSLVTDAVKTATDAVKASFNEKIEQRDTQIQNLTNQMNQSSASGKRAEIVAFCERQGLAKVTPAMKRVGIVDFMESLEAADAKETDKAIVCFAEGADGAKTEVKFSRREWFENFVESLPPFIQFGEQFGGLTATKDVQAIAADKRDADDEAEMLGAMGVGKTGGEK